MTAAESDTSTWKRIQAYRARHARAQIVIFFVLGFAVDIFTLRRIDNTRTLIKQGVFLLALTWLIGLETKYALKGFTPPKWLSKVLQFSEDGIHFFLGGLLSAFAVFYFKSASGLTSLAFLAVLLAILMANDSPRFRKLGLPLRFALYSFCVASYLAYLLPVVAGFLSPWLFLAAVATGTLVIYLFFRKVQAWSKSPSWAATRVAIPGLGVQALLVALYLLRVVPPVPLSVQFMGIYHGIEKDADGYQLMHERPDWKLWHHGDQHFDARPGDRIYCFVRIFAPARFRDQVRVRWSFDDPQRGWIKSDAIPMSISGGRDDGYRGYSYKEHYQPGAWRVEVMTEDGRDIGSLRFEVAPDQRTGERPPFKVDRD